MNSETAIFCLDCGQALKLGARFCTCCGAAVRAGAGAALTEADRSDPMVDVSAPSSVPFPTAPNAIPPEEIPPPPDGPGLTFAWRKKNAGGLQPIDELPPAATAKDPTADRSASRESGEVQALDLQRNVAVEVSTQTVAAFEDCVLPPAPSIWSFRTQTSALADKIVAGFASNSGGAVRPIVECAGRLVRAVLMHKDVYRDAASRGTLMGEALWLAVLFIVLSSTGLHVGTLPDSPSTFSIKVMLIRAAGWAGAVLAVRFVAKFQQNVDLPPSVWFRAMVFAQSVCLLSIVPLLNVFVTAWAITCTLAALMDVSGQEFKKAVVLLIVAGAASAIISSVLNSVLV